MMPFKEFVIARVKLFFFLLPLTVAAIVILKMIFAPEQKFTVDMLQMPFHTLVIGVLLSFVVPYFIIINVMIFVIYVLGILMTWFQKKCQSQKMTEQLRKLQKRQTMQNQSEDAQSNVTESREPFLK